MTLFNIASDAEFTGATVILADGRTYALSADHTNYAKLSEHLLSHLTDGKHDESLILDLVSPFDAIFRNLYNLSERVTRKGTTLFFDGDPLNNALTKIIIGILDEQGPSGDGWQAYVNFLEKLYTNPSKQSQDHLFHFLESNKITLHPDGDIIAYKGVLANGTSQHAGPGIVDGVEYKNDHLPNKVGSVITIPRSQVDDNRNQACSVGLHVGAYTYAKAFSEKLITVKVNPRDVVSVPNDSSNQKVRVARYVVVAENPGKKEYATSVLTQEEADALTPAQVSAVKKIVKAAATVVNNNVTVNKAAKAPKATKVTAPAAPAASGDPKVAEFEALIKDLIKANPGENLKRFRSKRITAARRAQFAQAAANLGYTL